MCLSFSSNSFNPRPRLQKVKAPLIKMNKPGRIHMAKKNQSKQHPYLGKRSSQLRKQIIPDLHARHGSNRCSKGGSKYTHAYAPASPSIPECGNLFHEEVKVLVNASQLVVFHPTPYTPCTHTPVHHRYTLWATRSLVRKNSAALLKGDKKQV